MKFSRWTPCSGKTWAHTLFVTQHTELNNLYWTYVPASQYAFRKGRSAGSSGAEVATVFTLRGANAHRMVADMKAWSSSFKDFDNWVRLSAILASVSYLETYIQMAGSLALESDPGALHGLSRSIDGTVYLKNSANYSMSHHVAGCTKGTWPQRLRNYRRLFGSVPTAVNDNLGELERLRQLRNSVGHFFGRPTTAHAMRARCAPIAMARVAEENLQKKLATVEKVVTAFDQHLSAHIGDYEAILFFHKNKKQIDAIRHRSPQKNLSVLFAQERFTPGLRYCGDLIRFYDRVA